MTRLYHTKVPLQKAPNWHSYTGIYKNHIKKCTKYSILHQCIKMSCVSLFPAHFQFWFNGYQTDTVVGVLCLVPALRAKRKHTRGPNPSHPVAIPTLPSLSILRISPSFGFLLMAWKDEETPGKTQLRESKAYKAAETKGSNQAPAQPLPFYFFILSFFIHFMFYSLYFGWIYSLSHKVALYHWATSWLHILYESLQFSHPQFSHPHFFFYFMEPHLALLRCLRVDSNDTLGNQVVLGITYGTSTCMAFF